MNHLNLSAKKFLVFSLVALTVGAGLAQGQRRGHTSRLTYVRGASKVYAFLPPYGKMKSMSQMQSEAQTARKTYTSILDRGTLARGKDLLEFSTPVKDQGHRGTCVAFASVALVEVMARKATSAVMDLSEQYVYWSSKAILEKNPNADGAEPIDMLMAMDPATQVAHNEYLGLPSEAAWTYQKNPWFADKMVHPDCVAAYKADPEQVPTECVTNGNPPREALIAKQIHIAQERRIETSPEAIVAMLNLGIPVELGVDVYQSAWGFDNPDSPNFKAGKVVMPKEGDEVIGGHAVLIVGYDMDSQVYLFKNSWGMDDWGSRSTWVKKASADLAIGSAVRTAGYGTIPMDYVRQFGEAAVAKLN